MSLINPPVGAIPKYLWDSAQENIVAILQVVSDTQAALEPTYAFKPDMDLAEPQIEDVLIDEEAANNIVNVTIGQVIPEDQSRYDKIHVVTYNVDCYTQGFNEEDPENPGTYLPPDKAAMARLKYLCAMVEYGLTQLKVFYLGLDANSMYPDTITLDFNPLEDASNSSTPYGAARFSFVCKFPYEYKDFEGLPELREFKLELEKWAAEFIYPPDA